MKANIHIDQTEALFLVTHIAINININVPNPAKLKNKNDDDVSMLFPNSLTAKFKSASSTVQSSWNSRHSTAMSTNLWFLVGASHAAALAVSCLQSVQLTSFPYL